MQLVLHLGLPYRDSGVSFRVTHFCLAELQFESSPTWKFSHVYSHDLYTTNDYTVSTLVSILLTKFGTFQSIWYQIGKNRILLRFDFIDLESHLP